MRHAIARYLYVAGIIGSLALAACSNGNTPLAIGGGPNGTSGTSGTINPVGGGTTSGPFIVVTPTPTPSPVPSPTPSPKGT